ncbi:hypothetical protein DPEC_G00274870 [Dallia pectoralis]|uniref:Uncharacterized protein n=1 Tax=Dallia pectoralis TaxID=75939 RepID=A0ACC2FL73_DALPE|nr:hypothetical protein DPEC_G00274870 [Dallia pectoralis]
MRRCIGKSWKTSRSERESAGNGGYRNAWPWRQLVKKLQRDDWRSQITPTPSQQPAFQTLCPQEEYMSFLYMSVKCHSYPVLLCFF